MSVIVKGMKMPENCMDCKINQYDEYEDDCVCPFSGVMCLSIGRQDACPLVALPDHHGRLVDADVLIDKYGEWYTEEGTEVGYIGTIKGIVDSMPTIEPERKVGKWKGYNADESNWRRNDGMPIFLVCSECNGVVLNNGSAHWNYCPNCGLKMEEGE